MHSIRDLRSKGESLNLMAELQNDTVLPCYGPDHDMEVVHERHRQGKDTVKQQSINDW